MENSERQLRAEKPLGSGICLVIIDFKAHERPQWYEVNRTCLLSQFIREIVIWMKSSISSPFACSRCNSLKSEAASELYDITGNLSIVACRVVMQEPNAVHLLDHKFGRRHVRNLHHSTCQLEKAPAKFKNTLKTYIYLFIAQEACRKRIVC
jgi:hypothetical protein